MVPEAGVVDDHVFDALAVAVIDHRHEGVKAVVGRTHRLAEVRAHRREVVRRQGLARTSGLGVVGLLEPQLGEHGSPARRPGEPRMPHGEDDRGPGLAHEPASNLGMGELIGALLDDIAFGQGRVYEPGHRPGVVAPPEERCGRLVDVPLEAVSIVGPIEEKEDAHQRRAGAGHAHDQRSAPASLGRQPVKRAGRIVHGVRRRPDLAGVQRHSPRLGDRVADLLPPQARAASRSARIDDHAGRIDPDLVGDSDEFVCLFGARL